MKKYEYKVYRPILENNWEARADEGNRLSEMGLEGWRVHSVISDKLTVGLAYLLEREIIKTHNEAVSMLALNIEGHIVPYTRMTQKGKWSSPRAQAYLSSQERIRLQMANFMALANLSPIGERPLRLEMEFVVTKRLRGCDLSNLVKAIEDAANGVLWCDDRWVEEIRAVRRLGDSEETHIDIQEI